MKNILISLTLVMALSTLGQSACFKENWWVSFDNEGESVCSSSRLIKGFHRNNLQGPDIIGLLEEAECCDMTFHWARSTLQTINSDWWLNFDSNDRWALCPNGYYLKGLYRSGNPGMLSNIEKGICTKPNDHPNYYGTCYNQNISLCFNSKNFCKCADDHFVTGLYKGSCNSLNCLDQLRCCKMVSNSESLDDLFKVKNHIMDKTRSRMALLAHYLGYAWCAGCSTPHVGEGYRREGDTWVADKSGGCHGYRSQHRLSMAYGDWGFEIQDIQYGDPVTEELHPETVDSGTFHNYDIQDATKVITRSETSTRSVSHTTTSSWRHVHELGIQITLPVVGASYRFSYENSLTTEDSNGRSHSTTFEITSSKTLAGNTSASWRMMMFKTRKTIPYTATIRVKFSTELQGFLRWGGGYNGGDTNYHVNHRGSGNRPTFHYRFGDNQTPFYRDLKRKSDTNSYPWMWSDMKSRHSDAQNVINYLSNQNNYVLTLTGQFEVVEGKNVDLTWEAARRVIRSAEHTYKQEEDTGKIKYLNHVAKPGPDDAPAPFPRSPAVKFQIDQTPMPELVYSQGN